MQQAKWHRYGKAASFLVVAGTAAVASYTHIQAVAEYGHQSALVAHLLPLSIDGMLLIASIAMAEDKAANRHPRGWARFGFWAGAAVSTAANVAATVVAHGADPVGVFIAAVAPLVLLVSIEIVSRPGRPMAVPMTEPATAPQVVTAAEFSADDAVVPVSPAPAGKQGPRGPYNGKSDYSKRHKRRLTGE